MDGTWIFKEKIKGHEEETITYDFIAGVGPTGYGKKMFGLAASHSGGGFERTDSGGYQQESDDTQDITGIHASGL